MKDTELKPDEIRKRIWGLSVRRSRLQRRLSSPPPMIEGCLHTIYKKCGNPDCHCATGKKHGPYLAIVSKVDGRSKLTYVSDKDVIKKASRYQKYNKDMARLRKINEKIFYWLKILRDKNTTTYEK